MISIAATTPAAADVPAIIAMIATMNNSNGSSNEMRNSNKNRNRKNINRNNDSTTYCIIGIYRSIYVPCVRIGYKGRTNMPCMRRTGIPNTRLRISLWPGMVLG